MKKAILLTFLFLLGAKIYAQSCENFPVADEARTRKLEKKFGGNDEIKKVSGFEAFDVAMDLKSVANDLYKKWFLYSVNEFKKEYAKEKKAAEKAEKLFKIGVAYFYLEDYLQAETFLAKSVKAKFTSNCNLYFLYLCNLKLDRKEEAEKYRKQFDEG